MFAFNALGQRRCNEIAPQVVHVNHLFFLDDAPSRTQFRATGLALKNDLAYVLPGIFQNVLNLAHLVIVKVMVISKDGSGNLC